MNTLYMFYFISFIFIAFSITMYYNENKRTSKKQKEEDRLCENAVLLRKYMKELSEEENKNFENKDWRIR
ncbi:MAG: hypothetical protein CMQ41_07805 [Gammaproteobacteria bacterium]|nr:hypothetical protein [Gammaproteobacteria bacterium]